MNDRKSNMSIHVRFLAATTIREAVEEAKEKAGLLNVACICFEFNGINFYIGRNANVLDVLEEFKAGSRYGFICSP